MQSLEEFFRLKTFEAIIIGFGLAGTPLVFKHATKNYKVALMEKEHFGGTCLNVGCTPTKAYVNLIQFSLK